MKTYELMCVFSEKENLYTEGVQCVGDLLKSLGAVLEKEEDYGRRTLSYMLRRESYGHYHFYLFKAPPGIFDKLNDRLALQSGLLRHLVVLKKNPRVRKVRIKNSSASRVDNVDPSKTTSSPKESIQV